MLDYNVEESEIDRRRKLHLSVAEFMDAWRVVPRLLIGLYCWITYEVITWYMNLKPYVLEGCNVEKVGEQCIVAAQTTGQSLLVSAIFGAATGIFGLYASTGRKWGEGVSNWRTKNGHKSPQSQSGSPNN